MRRPKKQREHRIGSGIKPDVMDSALLGLQSRVKFHQSELVGEKDEIVELKVAKQKVKEARAAYKEHPCDAMHKELNDAIREAERVEELELRKMDPSKAFQIAKRKALSFRAKADDVMKEIQQTKLDRNEAQMRADGMGVMRVDKKRAKLEAKFAMLVSEMRRYQTLMGAVYGNPDFAEGSKKNQRISLSLKARNAEGRGDKALSTMMREKRLALDLNDERLVASHAASNSKRIVSPKALKDGQKTSGRGTKAKSKGAGEVRSEKMGNYDRWGMTEAEQMRYVELLMKKDGNSN